MTNPIEMTAYRIMAETGLSARELAEMDMDSYARATGRPTPVQAALRALDAQVPGTPRQEHAPVQVQAQLPTPEPPGIDLANMDMPTYAQFRQQAGIGVGQKEGIGIFNAASRQAQLDATRRQTGRTALSQSNITPPPSLTGRQERQGDMRDHRTAAERFSTPGNSFSL